MPNTNSKIIVASPILGALIGTMAASSPAVIATGTTVFSYSVSGMVASGFGLIIGTVIGAAFGVGVALIGLGIKGLLYESTKHPKRMTGIRILGGLSTTLGAAGIGALIGSLIFPGIGTIIGGLIGLFFGIGASALITVAKNNIVGDITMAEHNYQSYISNLVQSTPHPTLKLSATPISSSTKNIADSASKANLDLELDPGEPVSNPILMSRS